MAKSIRFSGIRKGDGSDLFRFEPIWWNVDDLSENVKFKWVVSNDTGSYQDEDADISVDEARLLHAQFKPKALETIAYLTECIEAEKRSSDSGASDRLSATVAYAANFKSLVETIETAVGVDAEKYSHFHICVFEWESGY